MIDFTKKVSTLFVIILAISCLDSTTQVRLSNVSSTPTEMTLYFNKGQEKQLLFKGILDPSGIKTIKFKAVTDGILLLEWMDQSGQLQKRNFGYVTQNGQQKIDVDLFEKKEIQYFLHSATPYKPQFNNAKIELVTSKPSLDLYYKTDQKQKVGSLVAGLKGIDVMILKDQGIKHIVPVILIVHKIYKGYILVRLQPRNLDCISFYENEKWIPFKRVDLERLSLPTPSDVWMCKGFDFKNYKFEDSIK